jgi:hypothetical protein
MIAAVGLMFFIRMVSIAGAAVDAALLQMYHV